MLRKGLGFLICMVAVVAVWAAGKTSMLALMGQPELCLKLTAELSGDDGIILLERQEIDKVIGELKLNSLGATIGRLSKKFPHVDIFAVITPAGLIVFNAKNGCRLLDSSSDHSADKIRFALKKLIHKPVYVSVVSVRNVGVSPKLKEKTNALIDSIERLLTEKDQVQLLERSNLDLVNSERKLTGKQFQLINSAKVLSFEFEPEGNVAHINLKISVSNIKGNRLGQLEYKDIFGKKKGEAGQIVKDLEPLLKLQSVNGKRKKEAASFFAEYQTLIKNGKKYSEAAEKLNAALALEPMNSKYRYAELELYSKSCYNQVWRRWIDNSRRQLERCKKFHKDFPNYLSPDFNTKYIFNYYKVFQRAPYLFLSDRSGAHVAPTSGEAAEMDALCDELRPLFVADLKHNYCKFDLSDGINSDRELWCYCDAVWRSTLIEYSGEFAKWLDLRRNTFLKFYEDAEKYARKNPGSISKANERINSLVNSFWFHLDSRICDSNNQALIDYYKSSEKYIKFCEKSSLLSVKKAALRMDFLRCAVSFPRNKQTLEKLFNEYYEKMYKLDPDSFKSSQCWIDFYGFTTWWIRTPNFDKRCREKFREKKGLITAKENLKELCLKRKWDALVPYVEQMRNEHIAAIKKGTFCNIYSTLVHGFSDFKLPDNPNAIKIFNRMNADFSIKTFTYNQMFCGKKMILRGLTQHNGKIFMMFRERRKLCIGMWDPVRDSTDVILSPIKAFPQIYDRTSFIREKENRIAASDKYIVIPFQDGRVAVFSRTDEVWRVLPKMASAPVRGIVILNEKIYIACRHQHKYDSYLISFKPDGSEYKVILSYDRKDKQNEPEKINGMINCLVTVNSSDLAFLVFSKRKNIVFRYNTLKDTFERITTLPVNGNQDCLFMQNGVMYCNTQGFGSRLYRIDPATGKFECVFIQDEFNYRMNPKDHPVKVHSKWSIAPPYLLKNGYLWSSYMEPAVVDMTDPAKSPPLMMIPSPYLTDGPGQSVIYYGFYRCYVVTPKKEETRSSN